MQGDGVVFTERKEKKDFQLVTFIIINEINADSLLETQYSDCKSGWEV